MKNMVLSLVKKITTNIKVPGRYFLSSLVTRVFMPNDRRVEDKVGNYSITLDLDDTIQNHIYFRLYDDEEIQTVSRFLSEGSVFFDIGANIGYYSLIASQKVGKTGQVHAFEPIDRNFNHLRNTVLRNQITNITVNQVAVGDTPGKITLFMGVGNPGDSGWASLVSSKRRQIAVDVPLICLDDYVKEKGISRIRFIKLDVEGAEREVLLGGANILSDPEGPDLICEINPFLLKKRGFTSTALTRILAGYGYLCYDVKQLSRGPVNPEVVIERMTNILCVKDRQRVEYLLSGLQ